MNQQATDNRAWVRAAVVRHGLADQVADLLHDRYPAQSWNQSWAQAYSYGHNAQALHGNLLSHYACAYADICTDLCLTLPQPQFYAVWIGGEVFEGTWSEHWYFAEAEQNWP